MAEEAALKSSNFVLGGLTQTAAQQRTAPAPYAPPGQGYDYSMSGAYPSVAPPQVGGAMTIDDVVVRTVGLLALAGAVGAVSWLLLPRATLGVALFGSMITGFILLLAISFMRITNPYLIGAYAVVEGVFLGVISKFYEELFSGIVLQAAVGTFAVFAGMALVYKSRVIRVTSGFTKVMIGIGFGIMGLFLVNLVFALFGADLGIFGDPTDGKVEMLPILITLGITVWGALSFLLDFKLVEEAVRIGAPRKFAWYASFGIVVGLIFMYLQLLRLLALLRE